MKIVVGAWFSLPRLGSDVFSTLMRQGVRYDREMGFMLAAETDVESAVITLRRVLGEEVDLSLLCTVCLREACPSCPYLSTCDRGRVSPLCLCEEHASGEGAYRNYVNTFTQMLAE
jgi:hypothetical protein